VGVRYVDEKSRTVHEVRVRKEVIVSGGNVNSPRLLQLSRVAVAACSEPRCEVVHDLPAVGENFRGPLFCPPRSTGEESKTINEITAAQR